jgi:glutathione synthase/RimK-type ligase-like ATP-grasp enzyme
MASETYDIVLSSPFSNYDFFAHKLRELCGQMGISFFLADDVWVKEFLQKLQTKEIAVKVLLDLTANQTNPEDPYTLLAKEVKRQGGTVIDDPDITAAAAHKAKFHQMLLEHRIPVPETVIVNRSELESFKLTDEIKTKVGVPFVVKPAWGDSAVGVNLNGSSEKDLLESAKQAPNSDSFLIQQRLEMKDLGRYKGWFRVFHICRQVIPCWWDPVTNEYQLVTPAQMKRYNLAPLRRIMRGIARISKMKKFSSEICLHKDGKFYAVDYVNADPDMNPRCQWGSR